MASRPSDSSRPFDAFASDFCAARFKALGEPLRLRIVDLLRQGELSVTDIAAKLGSEVVTVSHHLQILKTADLVSPRRDGRFMYYSLPRDLLKKRGKSGQSLDLGCCTIEIPPPAEES